LDLPVEVHLESDAVLLEPLRAAVPQGQPAPEDAVSRI